MKRRPRNLFESKLYHTLKRHKVKFEYEGEKIAYVLARHYIPDFIVHTHVGKVYIEAKGQLRPEDKTKLRAVKKQHPELDIRLLFYASNKNYIRWAEKNGFRWAVNSIPRDWLKGL